MRGSSGTRPRPDLYGDGDENGHGTYCAGTAVGRDVNGMRIGVARGVTRVLIGKVLDKDGHGETENIYRAIHWALDVAAAASGVAT